MSPAEIRTMSDSDIVEMLVSLGPSDHAVAWLASVIADPTKVAGVAELSRRYSAKRDGRCALPRAKSAGSVSIDGAKLKAVLWRHRLPLKSVGPMIGKSDGLLSVICHKGSASFWTLDALATEVLDMRVEDLIAEIGTPEELQRLTA